MIQAVVVLRLQLARQLLILLVIKVTCLSNVVGSLRGRQVDAAGMVAAGVKVFGGGDKIILFVLLHILIRTWVKIYFIQPNNLK